jgi:Family of unknown function (DUF6174)
VPNYALERVLAARRAARSTRTLGVTVQIIGWPAMVMLSAMAACMTDDTSSRTKVDRDLWEAVKITHYEYSILHRLGMNRPIAYRVIVRDEILESVSLLCIHPLSADDCRVWSSSWSDKQGPKGSVYRPMTIPQLFDYIDGLSQDPNTAIQVDIDPTHGFPSRFSFDITTAFDDEEEFRIFNFKVLEREA